MPRDPEPARRKLLDSALTLFARSGIEAVSMREIRLAAGQRNAAATQYHFGSKEGLLKALLEEVLPPVVARRRELLAEARPDDALALARVAVAPLTELALGGPRERATIRFLAHLVDDQTRSWSRLADLLGDTEAARTSDLLRAWLPHVPPDVMSERLLVGLTGAVHACAYFTLGVDAERDRDAELFAANLADMFMGAMAAPVRQHHA